MKDKLGLGDPRSGGVAAGRSTTAAGESEGAAPRHSDNTGPQRPTRARAKPPVTPAGRPATVDSDPLAGAGSHVARHLVFALSVAIIAVVGRQLTRSLDLEALSAAIRHTPLAAIACTIIATTMSFVSLIARDATALRYARSRAPWYAVVLAGFCGASLSNAVGLGGLSGAAVRYRIYGAVGVRPDAVARIILIIAAGSAVGIVVSAGLIAVAAAAQIGALAHWPPGVTRLAGVAVLGATGLIVVGMRGRTMRLRGVSMPFPAPGLVAIQIAITAVDLLVSGAALWVLLPRGSIDLPTFIPVFVLAEALGGISHVPGGLGVFEAVILIALHQAVPAGETGAALLLYRAIYFILPLMLSSAFLAGFEVRRIANGGLVGLGQRRFAAAAARLGPAFLAVLTFAAGLMLVVSGANPIHPHRLAILWFHLPRPLVATSHFFGSVAGVLLLFIARGLFFRVDGAWLLAMVLTGAGFALSLARGYAFPETTVLAALWLMLAVTRRQFPRRASLIGQSFSLSWFLSAGCFAVGLLWMVRFAVHDTPFSHQPWWRVEVDADAPLSLRATLGISVLAIAFGLGQLLRLTKGSVPPPGAADLARARAIVARHDRTDAALVAMGDKAILFSASGDAFLMFAKRGRSWIALLDPVGPRREWPELIWRFVELAAAHAGRAAFYQIRAESLPHYIETGLRIIKIGEEARVDLRSFSLQGSRRSHLRYALKRGHRDGLAFTLVPPEAVWSVMPIVEALSAEWLAGRGRREKGFSVAAFRPDFIAGQMVALVTQDGAPVAFASVMTTASRREAVLGLMRHADGVSPYAMEFLFTNLILALKEADFQDFSLGLAPLSGLSDLPFAATWYHLGNLIWKHGNMLYNFQGLRLFKSKFDPVWEPRYLAVSGVLGPLFTLTDVAALTSAAPR